MGAALVFPNTVYVSGFPAGISRHLLLKIFGGNKGHIRDLEFINTPGEPKRAFIEYSHENSIPQALKMNGKRVCNHSEVLEVQLVDEAILCEHVPGEQNSAMEALRNLQKVLEYVLKEQHVHQLSQQLEVQRLTQCVAEGTRTVDKLKRAAASHKEKTEQAEQWLKVQLVDIRKQLEASEGRASQAQTRCDFMGTSLTEVKTQLQTIQKHMLARESATKDLQRCFQEACDQKESTIERLGLANNKAVMLEEELKVMKDENFAARSALWRTQAALDEADIRLRAAELRAETADKKRERVEDWLKDERETKRHVVLESQEVEKRCHRIARQVEGGYLEKLETLKSRLFVEAAERKEAENQLAQANAKLANAIVTDSLLAAFIKMENWAVRLLGELEEHEEPITLSRASSN